MCRVRCLARAELGTRSSPTLSPTDPVPRGLLTRPRLQYRLLTLGRREGGGDLGIAEVEGLEGGGVARITLG